MKIGLFIAYSPRTKFQNQGLGRQFTRLVEGFHKLTNEPVTIVCPSWLREEVQMMFSEMPPAAVEVIANHRIPWLLRAYNRIKSNKTGDARQSRLKRIGLWLREKYFKVRRFLGHFIASGLSSKNLLEVLGTVLVLAVLSLLAVPFLPVALIGIMIAATWSWANRKGVGSRLRARAAGPIAKIRLWLLRLEDGRVPSIRRLIYERMYDRETSDMKGAMLARKDIDIWYSPTIFWPEINSTRVPTVQCFPDIMMADFPTAFVTKYPDSMWQFRRAQLAIQTGKYFIAYSAATAKSGLQDRYDVAEDRIHVIPHAAMDLAPLINIQGTLDDIFARRKFATNLIEGYRNIRWQGSDYLKNFNFADTKYLFYASQLRPNKNVMNLIRAYELVLRERYKYVKLIITGQLSDDPEIQEFIHRRRMQYDVLSAYDVPPQVLAALYHRAELAVNPSLFEGGMPFTLTEALSVDTPVIMARIPQTLEIIGEGEVANACLFDPLSVDDIADRIVYGLENRQHLLNLQKPIFEKLRRRSWVNVAEDHVRVFERILENRAA